MAALEAAQQGAQQGADNSALVERVEVVEGQVAGLQEREGQLYVLLGKASRLAAGRD